MPITPTGPLSADILIVGETPSANDAKAHKHFSGNSGHLLSGVLHEAGLKLTDCLLTTVHDKPLWNIARLFTKYTPKTKTPNADLVIGIQKLEDLIEEVQPKLIIALGELALFALTGESGITKWRGSQLEYKGIPLLPTFHPTVVMKKYDWKFLLQQDLKRAAKYKLWEKPEYNFTIRPTFEQVMTRLDFFSHVADAASENPIYLSGDYETRCGHINTFGIGWSREDSICIPFMDVSKPDGYWTEYEEYEIVKAIRTLFKHPNIRWIWQNGSFDIQYAARFWQVVPRVDEDTMVMHHVCWAGLKKSLDFLSSLYCDYHVYWKEDSKIYDPTDAGTEEKLWTYNCKDCVTTWEAAEVLRSLIPDLGLEEVWQVQHDRIIAACKMMFRGVKRDDRYQASLVFEVEEARRERQQWLEDMIGHPLNVKSPKQMKEFFYDELGLPTVINRKTKKPTTDDKALSTLAKKCPLVRSIVTVIQDLRSIGVATGTFINMSPDIDGRMRSSYNVAGTETYRYSSSTNAFGSGGNLQNLSKGGAKAQGRFKLPNIKKMFIPDTGYDIIDVDLDRADAQVVAWEADDTVLKDAFKAGVDVHNINAADIYKIQNFDRSNKYHESCRVKAKACVHAMNYYVQAPTLAKLLGLTIREAQAVIDRWFLLHPAIKNWHHRIEDQLMQTRTVENKFGFRRFYFDRIEHLLPEALAWIPQSTVAIVIDKGLINLTNNLPEVQPLMQVHDSLVMQIPTLKTAQLLPRVKTELEIVIPYDDPLIIGVGAQRSSSSYGEVQECDWRGMYIKA